MLKVVKTTNVNDLSTALQVINQNTLFNNKLLKNIEANVVSQAQDISSINKKLQKPIKMKHLPTKRREALSQELFNKILLSSKPKHFNHLNFSRFRIGLTILYFSGLRVNEIRLLTLSEINQLKETRQCDFYQSKVNKNRNVMLSSKCLSAFTLIGKDIDLVYSKSPILYESSPSKWIALMNKHLVYYSSEFGTKLRSHSCRINFVTSLIAIETPLNIVKDMVGHTDLRSTLRYNRFLLLDAKRAELLDQAFN